MRDSGTTKRAAGLRASGATSHEGGSDISTVSTHVLDTALGRPAAGVPVTLDIWSGGIWVPAGGSVTGPDGRITDLPPLDPDAPAAARMVFAVREYLLATHGTAFFPEITVAFTAEPGDHYHVPLLLAPFGYATYRGS